MATSSVFTYALLPMWAIRHIMENEQSLVKWKIPQTTQACQWQALGAMISCALMWP